MRTPKSAIPALLLALLLTGLAGCSGDTDPGETPTPSPVTPFNAHPSTTVPTPTPTPTGPVRAPEDSNWTENQLAAVHLVDAYEEWNEAVGPDPRNADQMPMFQILGEPQLTTTTNRLIEIASEGNSYVGGFTPVIRAVGPEQVMDGRREIVVRQCEKSNPGSYAVVNGATTSGGDLRTERRYVVQWVEEVQGWRIVDITKMGSC
ncbi:MAG: hypothetical protein LBK42_11505 [Propionibacteriaceae bacterium]|nr:hypothetical protein [Propionibacteriaceae bacterium]